MTTETDYESFKDVSDEMCVKMAVEGTDEAFDELTKRHYEKIYGLAYRILGNVDNADDATQESFIEAYKSLESFQHRSKFSTWLYRVAVNTCKQFMRKNRSRMRAIAAFGENIRHQTQRSTKTPDHLVLEKERDKIVQSAINQLPEKQRLVVILFYMQHLKYREIAKIIGCPEGTVASRLNSALKKLRPKLIKEFE